MRQDTRSINKNRADLETLDEIWLFGYGSLIYKVDFPYLEAKSAFIRGWSRRFWQGSHDHRGTPTQPGRVLTLISEPQAKCFGMAYKVTADEFDHLDYREKNGYLRLITEIFFKDGSVRQGVLYIARPDNAAFLGEASESAIAKQIFNSSGPSGRNRDYVYQLADALRANDEVDEHVFAIERQLLNME